MKNNRKKLILKKEIISNLNGQQMFALKGGETDVPQDSECDYCESITCFGFNPENTFDCAVPTSTAQSNFCIFFGDSTDC